MFLNMKDRLVYSLSHIKQINIFKKFCFYKQPKPILTLEINNF